MCHVLFSFAVKILMFCTLLIAAIAIRHHRVWSVCLSSGARAGKVGLSTDSAKERLQPTKDVRRTA